jgi:benzoyl-CoA reductase/2-hydroxyglutaryl-CoA dehydratase subunit BcrC/BadD/HgdB
VDIKKFSAETKGKLADAWIEEAVECLDIECDDDWRKDLVIEKDIDGNVIFTNLSGKGTELVLKLEKKGFLQRIVIN